MRDTHNTMTAARTREERNARVAEQMKLEQRMAMMQMMMDRMQSAPARK